MLHIFKVFFKDILPKTEDVSHFSISKMAEESKHYDYFVVGGGSGGISSARRAASHGARVCVAEKARWGGTCVNVGCVPKKVMFNTSMIRETINMAKSYGYGVETADVSFNWATIKAARDAYVKRLNGIYERNLGNSNVDSAIGEASFIGPKTIKVGEQIFTVIVYQ